MRRIGYFLAVLALVVLLGPVFPHAARGHESQPGSLDIKQLAGNRYEVIWKAPIYYGRPHPARLKLPEHWQTVVGPTEQLLPDSHVYRQVIAIGEKGVNGSIAHSITLAIATLGFASAPLPPLHAAIALSILFLGPEIVRSWRGETSLTIRYPWIVAFLFGLLHGFGFASGLLTTGMPRAELAPALLFFNVGVELGQIGFVAVMLMLSQSFKMLEMRWPLWVQRAPGYAVGICGAYWTIQRTFILFGWRI